MLHYAVVFFVIALIAALFGFGGTTAHLVLEEAPAAGMRMGSRVRHSKFGDGVVTRVIDAHKVEVLFKDEPKTLAQGMS